MGELDIHDLNQYIRKYNTSVFVETGTGIGRGISYASQFSFKRLYSIEIMTSLYEKSKERLLDNRISLINNNSISGLKIVLGQVSENDLILFWLDAHFPGADFKLNSYDSYSDRPEIHMPLEEEISTIFSVRKNSKDVFIIDDLRIYEDGNFELGPWNLKSVYGKYSIDFIENKYKESHNFIRDYRHQGFLILVPK